MTGEEGDVSPVDDLKPKTGTKNWFRGKRPERIVNFSRSDPFLDAQCQSAHNTGGGQDVVGRPTGGVKVKWAGQH